MFVVLFEVHPHALQIDQYLAFGKLLRPELEQIDGFIDNERFSSTRTEGRILSLSTWRDEKALIRWRTHNHHHNVQEQGRSLVFADYRLRVGEVTVDTRPPSGHRVLEQRFDETETGSAKIISLIELDDHTPQRDEIIRAVAYDPTNTPTGHVDSELFTSIINPGKLVLLTGWHTAEAAQTWHGETLAPVIHPSLRYRCVRVIRTYGMAERSEAPQYYPAVSSAALFWS